MIMQQIDTERKRGYQHDHFFDGLGKVHAAENEEQ